MYHSKRSLTAQSRTLRSRLGVVICVLLMTSGAFVFRVPRLDARPMHGDEANQAFKAGILIEKGEYTYDPIEHHGPTLYYLTLPVTWATSAKTFAATTEWTYRCVPVVFGACMLLLLLLVRDGLSFGSILFGGVFMAISPALVFYSRYYVQETLLVFFSFAAIVSGWRYYQTRSAWWAVATGAMLGFMHATKETSALSYAAMGGALALTMAWSWVQGPRGAGASSARAGNAGAAETGAPQKTPHPHRFTLHVLFLVVAGAVVSVTLYSSFFTNIEGPLDSFRTYTTYVARAQNEHGKGIHDKPWDYYLQLLVYFCPPRLAPWGNRLSEFWDLPSIRSSFAVLGKGLVAGMVMVAVLALVAAVAGLARKNDGNRTLHLVRFLAFYTLLLTAMYSVIPYKTPWCIINFVQPMAVLAGVGAASLIRWGRFWPLRAVVALLIVAGAVHLGVVSYRANYVAYAEWRRNPYVYAHPSVVVRRIPKRAEELAKVSPDGHHMLIKVIVPTGDYWPLPWYLRGFDRVGYWNRIPDDADAPVIITSPGLEEALAAKLRNAYTEEYYELRPGVLMKVYIEKGLWDVFMASRP